MAALTSLAFTVISADRGGNRPRPFALLYQRIRKVATEYQPEARRRYDTIAPRCIVAAECESLVESAAASMDDQQRRVIDLAGLGDFDGAASGVEQATSRADALLVCPHVAGEPPGDQAIGTASTSSPIATNLRCIAPILGTELVSECRGCLLRIAIAQVDSTGVARRAKSCALMIAATSLAIENRRAADASPATRRSREGCPGPRATRGRATGAHRSMRYALCPLEGGGSHVEDPGCRNRAGPNLRRRRQGGFRRQACRRGKLQACLNTAPGRPDRPPMAAVPVVIRLASHDRDAELGCRA